MKHLIIISIIILAFSSCEKELLQTPETTKVSERFYTNEKEIEEAVNAVYATLQFGGNFNIGIPAMGELPGEDAYDATPANDGGKFGQLDDYDAIPQNGLIGDIWQDAYKGIQRANIVLSRIENISFKKEETKQSRIGEMQFIRALYYFNLVRTFGDVPLVTEEVLNPQEYFKQERTAKEKVYAQIKTDLTEAVKNLPTRTNKNKYRVVKSAAQTLLGKVELTLKNYNEAKKAFMAVINSRVHSLVSINEVFSIDHEMNDEVIFAVQFASGVNANSEGSDAYRMFNPTGRIVGKLTGTKGHGVLKESFYELYQENDARKTVYVGTISSGEVYNNKIAPPSTVISDAGNDWIVLRYADIVLLMAEIENQEGNQRQAITYVNQIRNRAGLADYTGDNTKEAIFAEIDLQRRLELVWEGHRWFDLLRQGRAQSVLGITDKNKLLMPIPASQIAASGGSLKQNEGYN